LAVRGRRLTVETRFTPSGVRMRLHSRREGTLNWLFLPGGPGIGSESLFELAAALDVPGSLWMVDLPGDGSNLAPPGTDPYAKWPGVLLEAAQAMPHVVFTGHSTGGMYLLNTPALADRVAGLALLSTAPDAAWRSHYLATTKAHPLAAFDAALRAYEADRSNETLRDLTAASAEWNFPPASMEAGRALLRRMPYNLDAVEWSDAHFDNDYVSSWWPSDLPVLIAAGAEDRIVGQSGWDDPKFGGANVIRRRIPGAGHFPWIDNPQAVRAAFADLARAIAGII
jgi:pimeloyl-ACP methyl ester carboxylesterase